MRPLQGHNECPRRCPWEHLHISVLYQQGSTLVAERPKQRHRGHLECTFGRWSDNMYTVRRVHEYLCFRGESVKRNRENCDADLSIASTCRRGGRTLIRRDPYMPFLGPEFMLRGMIGIGGRDQQVIFSPGFGKISPICTCFFGLGFHPQMELQVRVPEQRENGGNRSPPE